RQPKQFQIGRRSMAKYGELHISTQHVTSRSADFPVRSNERPAGAGAACQTFAFVSYMAADWKVRAPIRLRRPNQARATESKAVSHKVRKSQNPNPKTKVGSRVGRQRRKRSGADFWFR